MNKNEDNKPFVFRLSFLRKKYHEQLKRRDRYSSIEKSLRNNHWRSLTLERYALLHRIDGTYRTDGTSKIKRHPYNTKRPEVPRLLDTVPVVDTIFKPRFPDKIYHQQGSVQFSTVSTYEPIWTHDPNCIYGEDRLRRQDQTIQIVKVPNRYVKWYKSTKPFKKPRLGHRYQHKWVQDDIPWNLQEFLPKDGNKILKHRRYPIGLPTVVFDKLSSDVLIIILEYLGSNFNIDNLGERKLVQKDSTIYCWLRGLPSEDVDKKDSTSLFTEFDSNTGTDTDTSIDYFNWPYNIYYKGV
jgi:hypothetical protein